MHRYLKSIGFRGLQGDPAVWKLLSKIQKNPDKMQSFFVDDMSNREIMLKEYAPGLGVSVSGLRVKDKFYREYYFPYIQSKKVTTFSPCTIFRQVEKEAFLGICEDPHFGSSIIFYINNPSEVLKKQIKLEEQLETRGIYLSGLASTGKVLLPLGKTLSEKIAGRIYAENHAQMVEEARNGDENSFYVLAKEDYHLYEAVSRHIETEDVYSIVDTCFIPTGVECDQYTIIGDIYEIRKTQNVITNEQIYIFDLICNQTHFTVAISEQDLLGMPQIGRRFKGEIWLQGSVHFDEKVLDEINKE